LQSSDQPSIRRSLSNDWDEFSEGGSYEDWQTWDDNEWEEFKKKKQSITK